MPGQPLNPASANPASLAAPGQPLSGPFFQSVEADGLTDLREVFVAGKRSAAECEDAVVISADYLAVFDGMSSPFGRKTTPSTGWQASTAAARMLCTLAPDLDAAEAIAELSRAVAAVRPRELDGPFGTVCAIYSRSKRQIWRVGDVALRIGDAEYPANKRVDTAMTLFRQAVDQALLAAGKSIAELRETDPGLRASEPLLRVQHHLANRSGEWGYGVLDGSPVPSEYLEIFPINEEATQIVLATDGFPTAAASLREASEELAAALARDPLCINELAGMGKAPRSSQTVPDDRAYLRLELSHQAAPAPMSSEPDLSLGGTR